MRPNATKSQEQRPTAIRRLTPQVTLPPAEFLNTLSELHRTLLRRRCEEPTECVLDPVFSRSNAEQTVFGGTPQSTPIGDMASVSNDDSGVNLFIDVVGRAPSGEQEREMFLRFNYCRYRVMRVLRDFRGKQLTADAAREVLRWELLTRQMRSEIVRINVPLVLAMTKRTKIANVDPADMVSEGNLALLRSVDKFDCTRGFKFSTYACRAILKAFSRVASRTARYRGYFPTEFDPTLEKSDFSDQVRKGVEDDCVSELKSILGGNLAKLNDIEQQVIKARFAIDEEPIEETDEAKAKTLEQVGELIGVTKERVRQIQNKALSKLRVILEENVLAQ
ncbi:MAG: sigma-70 family RNA polymerase sigma factor [Phycisphaerales bacterium]|nr:sigma-70 family RNA polymerase sigma factor [Phycisphaerales bacterium]